MSAKERVNRVQLSGIPTYRQGTHDGLCVYYSAAMMLAALYPYMDSWFGESTAEDESNFSIEDPIIRNYEGPMNRGPKMSRKEKDRKILSRWFYNGENLEPVARTLNNVVEHSPFSTRFSYEKRTAHPKLVKDIRNQINDGLPVILGWDTEDLGCHAVLVVGYWQARHDWFLLNDPGGGMREVSWNMLKELRNRKTKFEIIKCDSHDGPRPDKFVRSSKEIEHGKSDIVYRWTPDQLWEDVERLFSPTNM